MQIEAITLFPDFIAAVRQYGIAGRAVERGLLQLSTWNPRDYANDNYNSVDDRPYGGGPGMVMQVEPLRTALNAAKQAADDRAKTIYLSPQGERVDQAWIQRLAQERALVLLCGRYEGIDQRLLDADVDLELSIGDYVLSGGELAAMVLIDAIARLLPGALGDAQSAEQESFTTGLLDHPHYSRPEASAGRQVPEVLLSGDHAAIERWRSKQALGWTWLRRPDLLEKLELDARAEALLQEFIEERFNNGDQAGIMRRRPE